MRKRLYCTILSVWVLCKVGEIWKLRQLKELHKNQTDKIVQYNLFLM